MRSAKAASRLRTIASARAFSLGDRKSTRLNSSHLVISYAVFCLNKKIKEHFNSYKDAIGTRWYPPHSRLITRLTLPEVLTYLSSVQASITRCHNHIAIPASRVGL